MKTFFFVASLLVLLSSQAFADNDPCRRGCWTPGQPTPAPTPVPAPAPHPHPIPHPAPVPAPVEYDCQIEMVDYYNQSLFIYTGTAETHKIACTIATRVCMNDVRLGYGGYGAKCWMIGR